MSWFVVGGIAIGATAGAIAGSEKGGDDVWKGALIGGAIGGAGGWAAAPAAAGAAPAAGAALAPEAAGAVGVAGGAAPAAGIMGAEAAAIPGIGAASSAPIAGTSATMLPGATTPIAAAAPQAAAGSTGIAGIGANAAAPIAGTSSATMPGAVSSAFAPGMQAPVQMIQTPAATEYAMFGGDTAPTAAKEYAMFGGDTASTASNVANQTPPPATDSPLKKGFESAKSWLSEPKNAMLTGVLGLGALSMFNNDNENNFGQPNVQPAGYPLSPNFRPSRYQPTRTYADGGPVQSGMFPQSQMDRTQFAVPSQMPISREVIGADYDATINPYTGDLPRFAEGGDTDSKRERYYKNSQQYAAMIDPRMRVQTPETPDWVRSRGVYHDEDPDTKYQDALTAAQTRMGKAASRANVKLGAMQKPTPMGKLNLGPVVNNEKQKADAGEDDGLAGGGITSLGGYAHGGNARLLRGPGDGMSDDIPATIADKQPARLADGEFVVPADVVSGLGNGSTEAGAKKLHQMMDKVRVDRTGTKKQGKQIKAEKYVPGLAEGGIAYDPNYYNPQYYQSQIDATNKAIEAQRAKISELQQTPAFDAKYYLAQNPDVAAAGVDPYWHYQTYGQKEARTPYESAKGFDPKYYLATQPDVAASQWASNPIYHYAMWGRNEGRSPYEGAQAGVLGVNVQDAAAINQINKDIASQQASMAPAQQRLEALQNTPVAYTPYTLANRPSAAEPQFYGNIYQEHYFDYAKPGYDMNANLGVWNNEYGGNAAPTARQNRIAQMGYDQQAAGQQSLENAQAAALKSRQMINENQSQGLENAQAAALKSRQEINKAAQNKRKGGILAAKRK